MTTVLRATMATSLIALLSACGGGGGSSGPSPAPQPPVSTGPSSTSTRALINFAQDGGQVTTLDNGVTRQTRLFQDGNTAGVVSVDRLAGTDIGLVQYRLGDDVFIYRLTGDPVASMSLPTGSYNGPLTLNYRFDDASNWRVVAGEVNLFLDFQSGDLAIGGLASNGIHSIELFGDAILEGGRFATDETTVRLRDAAGGGAMIRDEIGTVAGIAASHEGNQAIFGLVDGQNPDNGFAVEGGFTATLWQP